MSTTGSSRKKSYCYANAMNAIGILMLLQVFSCLSAFYLVSWGVEAEAAAAVVRVRRNPQITVMGMVYCDICSNNTFSNQSYFIPGAQVRIECTFKASSPKTAEEISFSVTRSTNKYGIYQLQIPSVDGIDCASEGGMGNHCQANLMFSSTSTCNIPGAATTSDEIAIKSKGENTCIYSLSALNYRPSKRNTDVCGH